MSTPNCTGGTIPSLQVINGDCSCVSIQSITWNNAGNQFTITLTNGQSITSPVLEGAEGATPVIAFRVSGTILQYNVDGGAWISLFDLASLTESNVLNNTYPNASTAGTAWETLGTYQLPAAKLASDGSEITIRTVFTTNAATPAPTQLVRQTFNGSALNTPLNIGFYAKNITKIIIETRLSRVSNTSVKYEQEVQYCVTSIGGESVAQNYVQSLQTIAGLNLTTTAYDIDADANSDVAGDITLESFETIYYKK